MAQRFGGKYSPDGGTDAPEPKRRGQYDGARVEPTGARSNILFIPPVVLVFTSFGSGAASLGVGIAAAALIAAAAFLTREGLRAEAAYNDRKVAKKPALPRKILASALIGVGVALAAWRNTPDLLGAGVYGLIAAVLHSVAFGIDPLRDKGVEGIDDFQQSRVAKAVDEAEQHLSAMMDAVKRAGDRAVEARVERFQTTAREMFRTVEEDPRDLTAARRFLGVYLLGARDASTKFADIYARTRDAQARTAYLDLLDDLEGNFAAKTSKLLEDDRSDLTIEIDVLRDRLNREGVRLD